MKPMENGLEKTPHIEHDDLVVEASQESALESDSEMEQELRDRVNVLPRPYTCLRCPRRFSMMKEKKNHTRYNRRVFHICFRRKIPAIYQLFLLKLKVTKSFSHSAGV